MFRILEHLLYTYRLKLEPYTCLFQVTLAKKSDSGQNISEVIKEEGIYITSSNVLVKGNYIGLLNLAVSVVISSGNYIGSSIPDDTLYQNCTNGSAR